MSVTDAPALEGLPERAAVYWRPRVSRRSLHRTGLWWTVNTICHTFPFVIAAALLTMLKPVTAPVALALLAHAWAIPELHAARGATVLRPKAPAEDGPERRALLLLGDLVDEASRVLHGATGLVLHTGELGTWIVGEAGAVLVAPGGRRVYCYCVKAIGNDLPAPDRIAHLLLALRCDERDFATVANLGFSGATWRLRRRLPAAQRPALAQALATARG